MIGLGFLCAIAFLWDVVLVRVMASLNMNDFGRFYYAARAFLAGHDMYAPSPATPLGGGQLAGTPQLFNLNPPHFHLVVIPLAALWTEPRRVAVDARKRPGLGGVRLDYCQ